MAKKKHNANELATVIDAVIDHQISLSPEKRDDEALPKAIAMLNMEAPGKKAKKAPVKKATPKLKEA